jgi:hypothetical protein
MLQAKANSSTSSNTNTNANEQKQTQQQSDVPPPPSQKVAKPSNDNNASSELMSQLDSLKKALEMQRSQFDEFKKNTERAERAREIDGMVSEYQKVMPGVPREEVVSIVSTTDKNVLQKIMQQMRDLGSKNTNAQQQQQQQQQSQTTNAPAARFPNFSSPQTPVDKIMNNVLQPPQLKNANANTAARVNKVVTRTEMPDGTTVDNIPGHQLPQLLPGMSQDTMGTVQQSLLRTAPQHPASLWNDPYIANNIGKAITHVNNI